MLPDLVLASASPARRRLLTQAGFPHHVQVSHFDEDSVQERDPHRLVVALALAKAQIVAPQFPQSLVLGCDSVLAIQGEVHGKPESREEAIARWQQMRGKVGYLYTGHALIDNLQKKEIRRCGVTEVHFADISDAMITAYVDSGEPMQCAGCFALEGKGGVLIEKINGCHTNVIGLSLPLFRQMLEELGYAPRRFWS